jgi:DNA polymerase III alpha subunit (gram-positive type)
MASKSKKTFFGHNYVVLDLETSGYSPEEGNFITEIAVIGVDGATLKETVRAETFVSAYGGEVINQEALDVTGISRGQIESGDSFKNVVKDLIDLAKSLKNGKHNKPILVAHNSKFERLFLVHLFKCAKKNIWDYFEMDMEDTMKMSRDRFHMESKHDLSTVAERFGLANDSAHRALADTEITFNVFVCFKSQFRQLKTTVVSGGKSKRFRETFKFPI